MASKDEGLFTFETQSDIHRETRGTDRENQGRAASRMMSEANRAEENMRDAISRIREQLDSIEVQLDSHAQTYSSYPSIVTTKAADLAVAAASRNQLLQLLGHLLGGERLEELLAPIDMT